jgi:hypothetical protein
MARRQSIPFLGSPARDATIACLPPFAGGGATYPPIGLGDCIALGTRQSFGGCAAPRPFRRRPRRRAAGRTRHRRSRETRQARTERAAGACRPWRDGRRDDAEEIRVACAPRS